MKTIEEAEQWSAPLLSLIFVFGLALELELANATSTSLLSTLQNRSRAESSDQKVRSSDEKTNTKFHFQNLLLNFWKMLTLHNFVHFSFLIQRSHDTGVFSVEAEDQEVKS